VRLLLMGNPNVGKSVLFNRLTGANVVAANYPGTTVEFTKGKMRVAGESVEVIDVPGTYSLDPTSKAEDVAVQMVDSMEADDVIVNVVDSTNLERSLGLTLQILKRRGRTVVALNLWDETRHTGIQIDERALEEKLGVACVPTVATTGIGVKDLVGRIEEARVSAYDFDDEERWHEIGNIVAEVQKLSHRHHTILERLGDASVRPVTGLFMAAIILFACFEVIRVVGEGLIGYVFEPLFHRLWAPVMLKLSGLLGGEGWLHNILIGNIDSIREKIDPDTLYSILIGRAEPINGIDLDGLLGHLFGESFGLLTTGLFVPIGAVLPYVFAFYLVLSFLEDSGYLPRLAVLLDTVMHRMGLHGMGMVPMLLGFGCNVPGALSARIMESRKERFIAATLMAITVPCMAQIAMIVGLAGEFGAQALLPIFLTLFTAWLAIGRLLHVFMKGESPEILIDIPPYRFPYMRGLAKKVWMRMIWFLKEAVPWVLVGVLFVNLLYTLGVIGFVGRITAPVVEGLLGLPREAAGGLIVGFLRKDVAVGMLEPLGLTLRQIIVASVVLAMYFPCVATFAVMIRELGVRDMLKSAAIMVASALVTGGILNFLLWAILG